MATILPGGGGGGVDILNKIDRVITRLNSINHNWN